MAVNAGAEMEAVASRATRTAGREASQKGLGMSIVGTVESVWRYPVKSMAGEEVEGAFLGFASLYGDRLFAFKSTASPKGFPYLTTLYAEPAELMVDVHTPSGELLSIDDPALLAMLGEGIDAANVLSLVQTDRALTDLRPVSWNAIPVAR
jgi:hypothetical protein